MLASVTREKRKGMKASCYDYKRSRTVTKRHSRFWKTKRLNHDFED
ncbi:hypothetical protein MtrunA17_Chr4g0010111 [Medicago truncatula]|uniref:Uncharacterized protein n=1 Tax=Medicago truncatula TaxID=3880 RepID=A0A396I8H1_MEDTR|nr:hypothetical protein MtrunA17_Chr4g0010111 [Medicago truncatula]